MSSLTPSLKYLFRFLFITLMFNQLVYAQFEMSEDFVQLGFSMSGFTKVYEDFQSVQYLHEGETKYTISRERFTTRERAQSFCWSHGGNLDDGYGALLFVLSGAANFDHFLNEVVSFEINDSLKGIWSWSSTEDHIQVIYDNTVEISDGPPMARQMGHEVFTQIIRVAINEPDYVIELPAICVSF